MIRALIISNLYLKV